MVDTFESYEFFERITNRLDDAYDLRLQELGLFDELDSKVDKLHDKRSDTKFLKKFYEKFLDIIYRHQNILIPS